MVATVVSDSFFFRQLFVSSFFVCVCVYLAFCTFIFGITDFFSSPDSLLFSFSLQVNVHTCVTCVESSLLTKRRWARTSVFTQARSLSPATFVIVPSLSEVIWSITATGTPEVRNWTCRVDCSSAYSFMSETMYLWHTCLVRIMIIVCFLNWVQYFV